MRTIFLTTLTALTIAACSEKQPKAVITVSLTNAPDRDVYVFEKENLMEKTAIDTIQMKDGKFIYTSTDVYPKKISFLAHEDPRNSIDLILEEGTITINGDYNEIKDVAMSGTSNAEKLTEYAEATKELRNSIDDLMTEWSQKMKKENTNNTSSDDYFNRTYKEISTNLYKVTEDFTNANLDNLVGLMLLTEWDAHNYNSATEALEKTSKITIPNAMTDRLRMLQKKFEKTAPGKIAPDFTAKTIDGKEVKLSDYRGKIVLIDFWASWCGPCRESIPQVKKTYDKYKDKGFVVIGVSTDENRDAWVKASEQEKLEWVNVSNLTRECPAAAAYNIVAIPTTFLIDKEGKIAANNPHGEELEKKIEELL